MSRAQVLLLGGTDEQIATRAAIGRWQPLHAGVYRVTGAAPSWHQRVLAACLAVSGVASHRTAGVLWGLDDVVPSRPEVVVGELGGWRLRGVTIHRTRRLEASDLTERDGIPVTRPARTLVDSAAVLSRDRLEGALDSALREGLVTVTSLDGYLNIVGRRGRRGMARLTELIVERSDGQRPFGSRREARLLRELEAAGLPRPVRQYELWDGTTFVCRFDLAWPDAMVAVEYHGYQHHVGRQRWAHDVTRQNDAVARGWLVFTATAATKPIASAIRSGLATRK